MEFAVVKSPSSYNALLGRTGMRSLGAVASTIHSMIKFPTSNGIATIATTRETQRECRQIEEAQALSRHARVIDPSSMQTSSKVVSPRASLAPVEVRPRRPGKEPMQLDDVSPRIIFPIEPKVQKKRSLAPDKRKVVTDEVNEWLKEGTIPFMGLQSRASKEEIDWKIESLMGFKYKCFLDAYKGYHQIQMTKKDEEKTAFHTEEGVFCYMKMPFGLKNVGATYQRLVDSAFKEQIGVNLEAYVDDM
ncbi:reverse transcriptase domain-containing protein [Tanacetum coccineum]